MKSELKRIVPVVGLVCCCLFACVSLAQADNVELMLLYQRDSGGWPKNYNRDAKLTGELREKLLKEKSRADAMIDNGATYGEIRRLAGAYRKKQDKRVYEAIVRGVKYLLEAQYENGGWPQRYPNPSGYAKHITFNDNAMIGVMELLRDIARSGEFAFLPKGMRERAGAAEQRGLACILKCQVVINGKPTVWCAQHDSVTLKPEKARSYELASLSGSESVKIVRYLMAIEKPSDEVKQAIEHAVKWFEASKLEGIEVVRKRDASLPKGYDRVVVNNPKARPMWARFYDLKTNQPIFCSRDGVPKKTLAEISYERRNGYSWLGRYAESLLAKDYPRWKKRVGE